MQPAARYAHIMMSLVADKLSRKTFDGNLKNELCVQVKHGFMNFLLIVLSKVKDERLPGC